MKLTASNFLSEFPKLDKTKIQKVIDAYPTVYEDFEFYNDDDEIKEAIDLFIEKANQLLAKSPRKYVRGDGKLRRKKPQPKPEPKKESKKKETKKKESNPKKETKKQTRKSAKTKLAEPPNWLKTLRSFKNAAGKERTVTGIRKMVMDIQDRFDAKRGLKTPHITLIREIQDKLLPYANRHTDRKVQLPQWTDLVEQCKKAIATVSVSSKVSKEDIKTATLAGTHKSRKKRETRKATRKKKAARKATRKPKK